MGDKVLYKAENLPVFQNKVYLTAEEATNSTTADVLLAQNVVTGIVENIVFNQDLMEYDENYQNEQASSEVFKKHLYDVGTLIHKYFSGGKVLEIGCGKGYFFEYLQQSGLEIIGVDPAYEGDNQHILKEKYREDLGLTADGLILRHVLEHVPDPLGFLDTIARANKGNGLIYIEVPCFDWIMDNRAWFDVFYEHVNYFRAGDFRRIFGNILEIGHSFGGQYLYVIADLASLTEPTVGKYDKISFPSDFKSGVHSVVERLRASKGKKIGVWGIASKGVIYALFMKRMGVDIDVAIDINPAKQGKYMAVSGMLISSPEQAAGQLSQGDILIIMNSNYLDEIKKQTNDMYEYITVDSYEV